MQNILVVDDVKTDRDVLGRIVASSGHHPIFATDGEQALAAAKTSRPALILMDVVMPGQDGFKTCRVLKSDPDTSSIPIVLVTSKGEDSDRFWGEQQGASDMITKPYTPDTITRVIRQYVR